jgi:FAD:protein FMN transferase
MIFTMRVVAALFVLIVRHASCQSSPIDPIRIEGLTMGTTYSVIYFDARGRDYKRSIDSLLLEVNKGISNYDPSSDVSSFNQNRHRFPLEGIHFRHTLQKSLEIAKASDGHFDPTVMPLVNLWGFGPVQNLQPSSAKIDSIKTFVGYQHISIHNDHVVKDRPDVQLDFGGIGQGYGVDVISKFFKDRNIENYLVELGGEGYAAGKNMKTNAPWRIGIIDPFSSKDDQQLLGYAIVENESFTTSGNFFNYRVINDKKYGHTISPFTGFPVQHDLISVSIFSKDCATADAWATAFMVAGKEKSIEFLQRNSQIAAVLISIENGARTIFISDRIKKNIFLEQAHDH